MNAARISVNVPEYRLLYAILLAVLVSARNGDRDTYLRCRNRLRQLKWKKNLYTKEKLTCNHGKIVDY